MSSAAVTLPAALTRWWDTLALLEPRLAIALGPMLRTIEEFVQRSDLGTAATGDVDGYDGLTRRGDPTRLLVSEWALAQDAPLEFLRRAAASELLFLQRARVDTRPRGQIVVLVDSGPEQVGAARLVQLAALVVLIGRAERRGTDLRLGVLGTAPGTWVDGGPSRVLDRWLTSRRAESPTPDDIGDAVAAWTSAVDDADETWVLTGSRAATGMPGRRRLVVAEECAWTPAGAGAVDVHVDGHHAELALPHGDVAVRALRGALLRPDRRVAASTPTTGAWAFTGAATTLLARSADPAAVARLEVRPEAPGRVKVLRFGGAVLTAAVMGRRVVALVERDGVIRVEVSGKHLGRTAAIAVTATDLPRRDDDTGSFAPLVFDGGGLLVRLDGLWWRLDPDNGVLPEDDLVAARPDARTDTPLLVRRSADAAGGLTLRGRAVPGLSTVPDDIVIGGDGGLAWPIGPRRWRVGRGSFTTLDEGDTVLGLHQVDDAPALVVLSADGVTLRLRWPAGRRTLTSWSSGTGPASVHPTRPWIAVQRPGGGVEVGDLTTGHTLVRTATA